MIPDVFDEYFEFCDDLLDNENTSEEVTIYYSSRGNTIGFDESVTITSDTINLRVYENPKNWSKNGGVEFIAGRCKIIGKKDDVIKLKGSSYFLISGIRYKLATEPMPHGFNSRYYSAFIDLE